MTTTVDLYNRALQVLGTRTTVSATEIANNSTNEAIQLNLVADSIRRKLLRMAPWACALKTVNLTYITSAPGTPENTSPPTTLWQPGQPIPPWAYEYQYPVDCVRACWIIPAAQVGQSNGVPITTAITGGSPSFWAGPPIKFAVQTDQFYPVTAAAIVSGGSGYVIGDIITLPERDPAVTPIGAPAQLLVTNVVAGAVSAISVISQLPNANPPQGGSYFVRQTNPVPQGTTTGSGTGATFNLTQSTSKSSQRVILCNQESASLVYCQDVSDPNLLDDAFIDAYCQILGAKVAMALTGDKKLANGAVSLANFTIEEARVMDGNEGMVVNDITPDWIRTRGVNFPSQNSGANFGFNWGSSWPYFG